MTRLQIFCGYVGIHTNYFIEMNEWVSIAIFVCAHIDLGTSNEGVWVTINPRDLVQVLIVSFGTDLSLSFFFLPPPPVIIIITTVTDMFSLVDSLFNTRYTCYGWFHCLLKQLITMLPDDDLKTGSLECYKN